MVTVTPGSAPPLSSTTRPSMADVLVADCACSGDGASQAAKKHSVTMKDRIVRTRTADEGAGTSPRAAIRNLLLRARVFEFRTPGRMTARVYHWRRDVSMSPRRSAPILSRVLCRLDREFGGF